MRPQTVRLIVISLVGLALLACQALGSRTSAPGSSGTPLPASAPTLAGGPTLPGVPTEAGALTEESAPTPGGEPTMLPPASNPPRVGLVWFQQDPQNPNFVSYCLTIDGTETNKAQVDSQIVVTAFDAGGQQLGDSTDFPGWILPGQTQVAAGSLYMNSTTRVDRLEVKAGSAGWLAELPGGKKTPLTAEGARFTTIDNSTYVIGLVRNSLDQTLTDVDVTAVAYDAGGKILGADDGIVSFIPAGQAAAVQVELKTSAAPAKVELHPRLGNGVGFVDSHATPLTVEKAGALLVNPTMVRTISVVANDADSAFGDAYYRVTVYDAQDQPVAVLEGEIAVVLPKSRHALIDTISFGADAAVARVDVQALPRPKDETPSLPAGLALPVTFDPVQYVPTPSHDNDSVTSIAVNPSSQSVDNVGVVAVLYDAAGQIVGGGQDSLGILPAGGKAKVAVRVDVKGDVARAELLPFLSSVPQAASSQAGSETPAAAAQAPKVLGQWFQHNASNQDVVDLAFLLENPNPSLDLVRGDCQVVGVDSTGLTVGSITAPYERLGAGGRMAVITSFTVNTGDTVAKIDVTCSQPGESQASSPLPLQAGPAAFRPFKDLAVVSGVISNTLDQELDGVTVYALAFDANDQIVGAGSSVDEFAVPAGGQVPVAVRLDPANGAVRAEIYPVVSAFGGPVAANGAQPLQVVTAGFDQSLDSPTDVTVAFVVKNPNSSQTLIAAHYLVALYDRTGALLATTGSEMTPLTYIYPGEQTGVALGLNVPGESHVDRVEVMPTQGLVKDNAGSNPLQTGKAAYIAEPFPKVTGVVSNLGGTDLKGLNVYAVLYDKDHHIIGGGQGSLDQVAAGGQAAVDVMVHSADAPASVELYAGLDTFGMTP